ncbi:TatD family hydrolase [Dermatobacter hominis]|uniref:TatD family hydrolase n=1 Tax=Dermatobacter hominis TaxID=2884263 RepID=UPI001D115488|nr:TatD family hydrolase [Dermatobacter hominis]UDY37711.1 TatD family hydrolase [Dermatobacter hominis]
MTGPDDMATSDGAATAPAAPGPTWIDNHCHLDGDDDPAALVAEALRAGVQELVTVGTDAERSAACLALAGRFDHVWATAGVHPHDADGGVAALSELVDAALDSGDRALVAIGECGLDHHYDHSPRDAQRRAFGEQIDLAHRTGLPLVIHTREAWDETFEVLAEHGVPERTVFHCFTGGPAEAERCLDVGALLSISGIVTFRSAQDLRDAVAGTPLDRLMVETDSPYLAPVPHRGKRNRPALVARVGEEVAALLGLPVDEVAAATTSTARRFYGLPRADVAGGAPA